MTKTNQFGLRLLSLLVAPLIVVTYPGMAYAKSSPKVESNEIFVTADSLERKVETKKKWTVPKRCNDGQVKVLFDAGFKKPGMLRGAWAITWRESKHHSLDESSRYFTGALGTWQIQTSAWSGKSWWSRSNMLNKNTQSRIVYKHFLRDGMHNWGYGYSFKTDTWYEDAGMYYSLWGAARTYAWVIAPFNTGWSLFPKKCTTKKI
jgi:hypothetical protein